MKYLAQFELYQKNPEEDINIGDYIVLLKADVEDITKGFKNDEIYKITSINVNLEYPYKIRNPFSYTILKKEQFRKATQEEEAVLKYNL